MILTLDAKRRLTLPASLVPARPAIIPSGVRRRGRRRGFPANSQDCGLAERAQSLPGKNGRSSPPAPRVFPNASSCELATRFRCSKPTRQKSRRRACHHWLEKHQHSATPVQSSSLNLAFWVRTKRGKQRAALQKWLTELVEAMHGRILDSTSQSLTCGRTCSTSYRQPVSRCRLKTAYIAAIARRHNLTIATGNVKDFQRPGIKVFDPFSEGS